MGIFNKYVIYIIQKPLHNLSLFTQMFQLMSDLRHFGLNLYFIYVLSSVVYLQMYTDLNRCVSKFVQWCPLLMVKPFLRHYFNFILIYLYKYDALKLYIGTFLMF